MKLSVVIPTIRGQQPKRGTLADLVLPLLRKVPDCEIIIAGCWPAGFVNPSLRSRVTCLKPNRFHRSYLRNFAIRHCRGTHIMLLDDDTVPLLSDRFLAQLRKLPSGAMLSMATRRYIGLGENLESILCQMRAANWSRESVRHLPMYHRDDEVYAAGITFFSNFGVVDRVSLERVGGFDEDFEGWGFEDVDLMNRMLRHGPLLSCRETATAVHVDHPVHPDKMQEARLNHLIAAGKYRKDAAIPNFSSTFYGIASKFVDRIETCRRLSRREVSTALQSAPHFRRFAKDISPTAAMVTRISEAGVDVLAVTLHGSVTRSETYRDIDMCVITGSGRDYFKVVNLPSGFRLEVHVAPLYAIRRHLDWLKYHPETAFLNWSKWSSMQFLYDTQGIVARFIAEVIRRNHNAFPFIVSFALGETLTLLQKKDPWDRLSAARQISALGKLSGLPVPAPEIGDDTIANWLLATCRQLQTKYRAAFEKAQRREVLVYPANFVGHHLLMGSSSIVQETDSGESRGLELGSISK